MLKGGELSKTNELESRWRMLTYWLSQYVVLDTVLLLLMQMLCIGFDMYILLLLIQMLILFHLFPLVGAGYCRFIIIYYRYVCNKVYIYISHIESEIELHKLIFITHIY